jgi:uncharacterized protein (TIGR03435 family)
MRISFLLVVVTAVAASGLLGQTQANPPAFEVVSIKPSNPQGGRMEMNGFYTYPGGRVVGHGCTLEYLIELAFEIQSFQVSGGPGWMNVDRFEIEARPPASSLSSKANPLSPKASPSAEQRQMLQALLADRFQMKFRREIKQGPVYVLLKGSKPLRLEAAKDQGKSDFSWVGSPRGGTITGDGMAGENISMPILASRLSRYLERPVLDQTGITGFFDFKFDYASDEPHPDVVSAILASAQAIGLKLESSRGTVETIMIDHAEKPSLNWHSSLCPRITGYRKA